MTAPILIVDDNPTNLKLARIVLEGEGYSVETAEDAEAALLVLERITPRIVLMDLQLPGMNGLELTRSLRQNSRWDETWIVALTAYAMKGDEQKALAAGCDAYLTKPLDLDKFSSTVSSLSKQARSPSARDIRDL
jgi:CheY-like chemotaxis protein